MRHSALMWVALAGAMWGCQVQTDLNSPCVLLRSNPDGGMLPLTEAEVQASAGANTGVIFIGSTECKSRVCLRDSAFVTGAGLNDVALGYCSQPCAAGSACPSYDPALDKSSDRLSCQPLVLDKETLARLDLGFTESSFCARGAPGAN